MFLHDAQPLEEIAAALIAGGRAMAPRADGVDLRREADVLVSGIAGLGMDVLHGRRALAEVRRTLDYQLDRLLPAPVR